MNTYQLSRFWIMFIIVLLMISGLWGVGTTQPIVAAKPNVHKLTAESTDMLAHAVGSEWHDKNKSPLVVDFDKTSPNTPDGISQWLQSQGAKLRPMPKAGISSKKKMLVLRMAFADPYCLYLFEKQFKMMICLLIVSIIQCFQKCYR